MKPKSKPAKRRKYYIDREVWLIDPDGRQVPLGHLRINELVKQANELVKTQACDSSQSSK